MPSTAKIALGIETIDLVPLDKLKEGLAAVTALEKSYVDEADGINEATDRFSQKLHGVDAAILRIIAAVEKAKGTKWELPKLGGPSVDDGGAGAGKGLFEQLGKDAKAELAKIQDDLAARLRTLVAPEDLVPAVEALSKFPEAVRERIVDQVKGGSLIGPLLEDAKNEASAFAPLLGKSIAEDIATEVGREPIKIDVRASAGAFDFDTFRDALDLARAPAGSLTQQLENLDAAQKKIAGSTVSWKDVLEGLAPELQELDDLVLQLGGNYQTAAEILGPLTETHTSFAEAADAVQAAFDRVVDAGGTWNAMLDEMANRALVTGAGMQVLEAAATAAIDAIVAQARAGSLSARGILVAVLDAVSGVLKAIAQESVVKAVKEIAEALSSTASYDYGAAAAHYAAAAKWGAVAVAATAGAAVVAGGAGGTQRAGAKEGGLVAGSEVGDRVPIMAEGGEGIITARVMRSIFGGRAAILSTGAFQVVAAAGRAARQAAETIEDVLELAPATAEGQEAVTPGSRERSAPAPATSSPVITRLASSMAAAFESVTQTATSLEQVVDGGSSTETTSTSTRGPHSSFWYDDMLRVSRRISDLSDDTVHVLHDTRELIKGSLFTLEGAVRSIPAALSGNGPHGQPWPLGRSGRPESPTEQHGESPFEPGIPPPWWENGTWPTWGKPPLPGEGGVPWEPGPWQRGQGGGGGAFGGGGGFEALVSAVAEASAIATAPSLPDISAVAEIFNASSGLSRYDGALRDAAAAGLDTRTIAGLLEDLGDSVDEQTATLEGAIGKQTRDLDTSFSRAGETRPSASISATFHGASRNQAEQLLEDINRLVRDQGFELHSSNLTESSPDKQR